MWHLSKAGIVNVILVSLTDSWPRITGSTCRILIHFVEQIMLLDPKLNVQLLLSCFSVGALRAMLGVKSVGLWSRGSKICIFSVPCPALCGSCWSYSPIASATGASHRWATCWACGLAFGMGLTFSSCFPGPSTHPAKTISRLSRLPCKRVALKSLEKGTATHSSILAWRIPWAEEPGGLSSMGSQSRT